MEHTSICMFQAAKSFADKQIYTWLGCDYHMADLRLEKPFATILHVYITAITQCTTTTWMYRTGNPCGIITKKWFTCLVSGELLTSNNITGIIEHTHRMNDPWGLDSITYIMFRLANIPSSAYPPTPEVATTLSLLMKFIWVNEQTHTIEW